MKSFAFISLLASILAGGAIATTPLPFTCVDKEVLSTTYVGLNKDVKAEVLSCANTLATRDLVTKRQTDVCGATCNTNCFTPSGGGPNPNDCQVIADALLYDGENVGPLFNITVGTPIYMQYASCESFFVNQVNYNLTYCRSDWSSVIDYVALNCQAQQNAHGGNCVASDQSWFIQVQTS
ncbi:hypothetical protein HYDPIDRAFT_115462 [Hydnomerulius pinastri MD-312]|uniref:Uncharacterized protein n=1 Tax=Hydnomerulius pinastri MD-312 TaxID=994086 RepID=A0A0C9VUK1_9AGAM|nr:hypothetical protein HYDPIDRAFT_115462 [Hydnomerulius pinastri MD-312]